MCGRNQGQEIDGNVWFAQWTEREEVISFLEFLDSTGHS